MDANQDIMLTLEDSSRYISRWVFPAEQLGKGVYAFHQAGNLHARHGSLESVLAAAQEDILKEAGLPFTAQNVARIAETRVLQP